jgi:hypothetical protein
LALSLRREIKVMGSPVAGYGGTAKISTFAIANVKQWELPLATDLYDTSSLGSQWKTYTPGLQGAEAKVDVFFDLTDTNGQVALNTAWLNSTSVALSLLTSSAGGATVHTYSGTAYIKGIDIKDPVGAPEEASLTLTLSGAISYT